MTFSSNPMSDFIDFNKNSNAFLILGIILSILGLLAIGFSTFTTLLSVILLGAFIFAGGILVLIDAFTFWRVRKKGFVIHLLMGFLYLLVGATLMFSPVSGAISLTLILGILFLIMGIFRIFYSLGYRILGWGWSLFNGIITLILGLLILSGWPSVSLWVIGLFIGIDLLLAGITYIMLSAAGRRLSP